MAERSGQTDQFLARHGWSDATRTPVAGDASNRRYERLSKADGTTAILMDAPGEKGEDVRPFVHIARHLRTLGLSAPEIYHSDIAQGLLLIEDLGDGLFARLLEKSPSMERDLYEACVDVLDLLHEAPLPALAVYDADRMTELAALPYVWYQRDSGAGATFQKLFHPLCKQLEQTDPVLVQRDYHAENLIWLPERHGAARVGLLDFQDAMSGHPAYDLVSVLQDARRDVPRDLESRMIDRYLSKKPFVRDGFLRDYAILGVQRNMRILGVFARLCVRDNKQGYVDLMPRVWSHIQTNLEHPALADIAAHVHETLAVPGPENLMEMKSRCATPA